MHINVWYAILKGTWLAPLHLGARVSLHFKHTVIVAPYNKTYLTPDEQVDLLTSRGMKVTDREKAKSCLSRIGYYRLSAYWYPFRKSLRETDPKTGKVKTTLLDDFKDHTDFPTILDLYVYDKKLRLIVLDALERVEIAVRTDIALLLGKHDPWAHMDANLLHGNFTKKPAWKGATKTGHTEWMIRLDDKFRRSKEDFTKHFKAKYSGQRPPIWVAVELWDFGALSHFFAGMRNADRDTLAQSYGIPNGRILETWLRTLNDIRNICAHHSRLWNRPLAAQPSWPKQHEIAELDHLVGNTHSLTRQYVALVILQLLLNKINPSSTWGERLKAHVVELPDNPYVTLHSAGFPAGWEKLGIWNSK